jgi:RNA polymerase sigma-70 factor (ECF subfamily)
MKKEITKEEAELIFREHSAFIYQQVLLITRSKVLADDITQDTFIRVFANYHKYDATRPIRHWIYRIAANVAHNALRRYKWRSFIGISSKKEELNPVEEAVLESEDEKELLREIDRLPFKSRQVLVLHFFSGMKLQEIADMLHVPLGTCKSRLNAGLTSLKKRLGENDLQVTKGGDSYEAN